VFHTLFLLCFRNGSQFRAESQDESHVDVIGYLTKRSEVVVGEKCWQLCFCNNDINEKVQKLIFLSVINMVITDIIDL
jgi:hypothetical protein